MESELEVKILVLRMSVALLNKLKLEMDIVESNLQEFTDRLKKAPNIFPDGDEFRVRFDVLAKEFFVKCVDVNSAKTQMESILSMVTKPCSLFECAMEKVFELKLPTEELPKTIVIEVLEWPNQKVENTRKKLVQIDQLNLDEINFFSG
eukprot:GFUD01035217.1.p1 GENE.GFUD01035217.1~~GFUD01035217.1.p1  ORF type:complete len:149 (-),score=48.51 GFUD01035217.1:103-549(-)